MAAGKTLTRRNQQPFLSRDGVLVLVSVFMNAIPLGYMNVLPLVYLLKIGYSPVTIGTIYAVSGIANTIGYTPFGVLADRYGRKKIMILGSILPIISYVIFGLTTDPYFLIAASILGGVGVAGGLAVAMSSTAQLPLLAEATSDEHRTTVYAILEGTATVALSIGSFSSFLPGFIAHVFGGSDVLAHSASYLLMAAVMGASVIPLLFIREGPRLFSSQKGRREELADAEEAPDPLVLSGRVDAGAAERIPRRISVSSWSHIAKFSLVYALLGLGFGVLVQLLPTWYGLRFGVSEEAVGLWAGIAQVLTILAIPLIPLLVRKQGAVVASVFSGIASCVPFALMPLSGSFEIAASFYAARSVLAAVSTVVLQSYVVGSVTERERATTIGIAFTAWGVAYSIATGIAGGLLAADLLYVPFLIGIAAYLGSSVAFFRFFRRSEP